MLVTADFLASAQRPCNKAQPSGYSVPTIFRNFDIARKSDLGYIIYSKAAKIVKKRNN